MINDFETSNNEAYYDLFDDYGLIEASFAQQYGIRLRNEDDMTWDEFCNLLSGLNGYTPLGNIVRIRSEKDRETIKKFSPEEKRIYTEWRKKQFEEKEIKKDDKTTKENYDRMMKDLQIKLKVMAINSRSR